MTPPAPGPLGSETAGPDEPGRHFLKPPPIPPETDVEWAAPLHGAAESTGPYTLEAMLQLAAENNPTLLQSRLHISSTLAQAMQAGLYPNPTFSYVQEQIGLETADEKDSPGEFQGGVLQQRFVTANKLELSRNKYRQRAKVAEHLAVAQQFRVCNDVRIHFHRAIAATRTLELQQEMLKTAEDNVVTVREMYNLGQANRADAHRANIELQQHRLMVLKATNDLRRHLVELTALTGVELCNVQIDGALESSRELIDFEAACARMFAESPEVLAAQAKLREDHVTLARENVEWIPDVVVSGGAGYNYETDETVGTASIGIEIPLFDRNQGTIRQAQADLVRQRAEVRRTRLTLRRMLAGEYDRYLTAWQHAMNYETVVLPESREAYRLSLESYRDNRAEWPDVLAAQRAYTQRRIEYTGHLLARRTSEVLIDGYLLDGGLDAAMNPTPAGHIDSTPKPR